MIMCGNRSLWMAAGAGVLTAQASLAQCTYSSSALDAFIAIGNPEFGQTQHPGAAWTFHRSDLENALLTRIDYPGTWTGSAWGAADQSYFVPIVGPVMSPNPAENQNNFYRRPPSFRGLFLHPGVGTVDARAEFSPQAAVTITSLSLEVEHLGGASPDAYVGVILRRAGGDITLIPSTRVASLAPALTLSATAGILPRVLLPGERIQVWGSNGGDPTEDWMNINATVGLSGLPVITVQPPAPASGCAGGAAEFRVAAPGATGYQWAFNGVPLSDEPGRIAGAGGPTLVVSNASSADEGLYSCTVSNTCGSVTSSAARLSLCLGDFNCDGGVDGGDVDAFFGAWEAGEPIADVNADGGVDGADVELFFERWEGGC